MSYHVPVTVFNMKLTGSEVQAVAAVWWLDNFHVAKPYQSSFTALDGMQTWSSDENPSVRLFP